MSPPQPTRGSGERRELLAGSGAEPQPKTDYVVFRRPQNATLCSYMIKSEGAICISVPYSKLWGPVSPMIYARASGDVSIKRTIVGDVFVEVTGTCCW